MFENLILIIVVILLAIAVPIAIARWIFRVNDIVHHLKNIDKAICRIVSRVDPEKVTLAPRDEPSDFESLKAELDAIRKHLARLDYFADQQHKRVTAARPQQNKQ